MMTRLKRWWALRKLAHLNYPDPEATLDWLERRRLLLEREQRR